MFTLWFKKDGKWLWIEIFDYATVDIVRDALKSKGYEVADNFFNSNKTSTVKENT